MNEKYAVWIKANYTRLNSYGKCVLATKKMVKAFPELKRVSGHIEDAQWGRRAHWWCVSPEGLVIDPTAAQFPALYEYEEWKPGNLARVGKCMNCGKELWEPIQSLANVPLRSICSEACQKALMEEYE